MREIQLTQGQVAIVDDDMFEWLSKWKWRASKSTHTKSYYAVRMPKRLLGKRAVVLMHREIMRAKNGENVDHINHDTLNNLRENLRICTRSQNMMNQRKHANNASGYKGVTKHGSGWKARIVINGRLRHIKTWPTPELAALAYDKAAKENYGEFANLNFPD